MTSHAGTSVVLLSVTERLANNASAHQIAKTLDDFIHRALSCVVSVSALADVAYCDVLYYFVLGSKKRKITAHERAAFADLLFVFLMSDDFEEKSKALKNFKIERQINFRILKFFCNATKTWPDVYAALLSRGSPSVRAANAVLKNNVFGAVLAYKKTTFYDMYVASKTASLFAGFAYTFRCWVVEKYIRWAHQKAMGYIRHTGLHIDPDDLLDNLFVNILTALDKYQSDKGALTSYIEQWVRNGATQAASGHEYGVAFTIPAAQRRKKLDSGEAFDNFAHNLENAIDVGDSNPSAEKALEDEQRALYCYALLKAWSRHAYSLASLDIPMTFTQNQRSRLAATLKQGTDRWYNGAKPKQTPLGTSSPLRIMRNFWTCLKLPPTNGTASAALASCGPSASYGLKLSPTKAEHIAGQSSRRALTRRRKST